MSRTDKSSKKVPLSERYSTVFTWGDRTFTLETFEASDDETKLLFTKMLEQALRDSVSLAKYQTPEEELNYKTAIHLLFDPKHRISFGAYELSLADIAQYMKVDLDWIRRKAAERIKRARRKKR